MYKAEMVADSITSEGHRLSTMLVTMPRIVLAEFNTHRMLSRNSASSRAIPFKRMAETIQTSPFIPLKWMKDHSGMQGVEYLGPEATESSKYLWLKARDKAVEIASTLNQIGMVTKQLCNRLLEPFMWTTVLVSATEWENFFALRLHPDAEIHIQQVAEYMLNCLNNSEPKFLKPGEWHIPFGDQIDENALADLTYGTDRVDEWKAETGIVHYKLKVATARCAQTSYTVIDQEGKPMDYVKLIALHDRLMASGHWSPFEHCAQAGFPGTLSWSRCGGWYGNFRGFKQYRKFFKEENRKDSRLIKKEVPNG